MQAYDPTYFESIWKQVNYAFGEPWNKAAASAACGSDGDFPVRPDIVVQFLEIGQSRRILNTQFIALSRVMSSVAKPTFPDIDKQKGEVLAGFYTGRHEGDGAGEGEWQHELNSAYMDGDGLGLGIVQVGLEKNPESGYKRVTLRHSPLLNTLGDPHYRNPGRWRWIAFVHYLDVEDAVARFGAECRKYARPWTDSQSSIPMEYVRIIEYYDMGFGPNGKPTRAIVPQNLANPPLKREVNEFGCLPFAYYMHFLAPGMRRPVGRIALQMATQEAINALEKSAIETCQDGAFDLVDMDQLNANDVKLRNKGDRNLKIRIERPSATGAPPYIRVPAKEVAQTWQVLRDLLDRQFNTDSGTTDLDRGSLSSTARTLGENELLDARSQNQSSWSELQALQLLRRTVEKVLRIARIGDRDPVMVPVFGHPVLLNDPEVPQSWIDAFIPGNLRVALGEESLRKADLDAERAMRLKGLQLVAPYVGTTLSPLWHSEEMLKAIGEPDPKAAFMTPEEQQQAAMAAQVSGPQV